MCQQEDQTPVPPDDPHVGPARVHDYLRGGAANFRPDRAAAHRLLSRFPGARAVIEHNLRFQRRAIHFLAEQGIRQFIDLGSGIPAVDGIHDVIRTAAPDSSTVFVDLDELAAALAEELFRDTKGVVFLQRDIRDPEGLFHDSRLGDTINLDQPVALLLTTTGGSLSGEDRPVELLDHYRSHIAPGSYLALSQPSTGSQPSRGTGKHAGITLRSRDEIERWMSGFELVDPGVVPVEQWRPEYDTAPGDCEYLAAVARKTMR